MKYAGIDAIISIVENVKARFANKLHSHEISEITDLQKKLDELMPPPDIETSEDVIIRINQLTHIVNDLNDTATELRTTIDTLIPAIGEIYITLSDENPSIKFGGTWEQIKDVFLLACGDAYSIGSTGGEATHTLTVNEIPSHSHTFQRHMLNRDDDGTNTGQSGYGVSNKTIDIYEANTYPTGNGQSHNNMPPYLSVYVWKRIA